jgi:hypothetical protein
MRTTMPCLVGRHESAIPYSPPNDHTGFIYSSYRAAPTDTQRDIPSSNSSHQPSVYVSSSVGGLYPHSPSRTPLQRTGSGLVSVSEEAPEIR